MRECLTYIFILSEDCWDSGDLKSMIFLLHKVKVTIHIGFRGLSTLPNRRDLSGFKNINVNLTWQCVLLGNKLLKQWAPAHRFARYNLRLTDIGGCH